MTRPSAREGSEGRGCRGRSALGRAAGRPRERRLDPAAGQALKGELRADRVAKPRTGAGLPGLGAGEAGTPVGSQSAVGAQSQGDEGGRTDRGAGAQGRSAPSAGHGQGPRAGEGGEAGEPFAGHPPKTPGSGGHPGRRENGAQGERRAESPRARQGDEQAGGRPRSRACPGEQTPSADPGALADPKGLPAVCGAQRVVRESVEGVRAPRQAVDAASERLGNGAHRARATGRSTTAVP
jgi:hypothetical protein